MPPPAAQAPTPVAAPPVLAPAIPEQALPASTLHHGSADLWARALDAAPGKQARAILAHVRPVELSETKWVIACDDPPMRKVVEVRLTEIADIVRAVCPAARLELATASASAPADGQAAPAPPGPPDEPEIVRIAAELFGARVVNVQRKDRINGNG